MTLRRPAAHLPMGWRRSGDESHWETRSSKGESFSFVSRRDARPHSAIEGRQMDAWLHGMQGDGEASEGNRRPYRTPSFSGVSSCGNTTASSLGSRESLQSEFFVPVGCTGSLERVHISQTPKKEQSQLGYVTPVKTGWLPIQRRAITVDERQMASPQPAVQVKLKQPITPTFLKSRGTVSLHQDGQAERSPRRTWQTPNRSSPVIKKVLDKQDCATSQQRRPGIWKTLRRGWTNTRLSGSGSAQPLNEISSGPREEPSLVTRSRIEEPSRRTFAEYGRPDWVQQDPPRQPRRVEEPSLCSPPASTATPPFQPYRRHSLQPSHIQTTSTPATLIPHSKVGFSSITISSRKVNRSASFTAADDMNPRKATIVKVTEQRTTVSSAPRRKAAIIKVTELKESYSPGTRSGNGFAPVEAATTSPLQNGKSPPAELSEQEPKRAAVRKWSLGLPQESFEESPNKDHQGAFSGRWSSTPCLTLIQTPEPHQSPEEVLARNAAAIIANIKLQRQLSMKKASPCNSEEDSSASPRGNSATDGGQCTKARDDVPKRDESRAQPAPTIPDLQKSHRSVSLQEALRRSRPRFIARSQERVQEMARRAQERKKRSRSGGPQTSDTRSQRQARSSNDNLFKSREGAKELKSNRPITDVRRQKEEEKKKKEACLTNRQRMDIFKKKLLDQILHRSSN
ncbi:(E2-independent) E3 ubiquitin-conjugating enzyme FATS [Syngnathus typhle]|uniref:(E2-independent) E3 ubiquitin-conjugating enzyme FATS n=1 Tax=Syngnathus typhle TaxID=161592 RepID=UPI002A6A62ED|nr:(E2-independent) E3 ubiquitin-conjugating enzyme FATS [Syngnathus typhle]